MIKYSELKIQRLGRGYDRDCHSYNMETNFDYYRMRSDCVNSCYQDQMRLICKVDSGYFMSYSLLREDYFVNASDKIISCYDQDYNKDNLKIWRDCEKMYKPECYMKYYSIEVKRFDNQKNIFIRHGENPDIFVEHIPEITLICFICNFGGLLGMWSGLSLFSLFNDMMHDFT